MSRRRNHESQATFPIAMPQVGDPLPPHSAEAETGVLGCIMLEPKQGVELCRARNLSSEVFYDLRHQTLFDVVAQMIDAGEHCDPITLQQRLRDNNQLEALGGMSYIAGLMNCVPSAANLEYYLEIIIEKAALRKMIQIGTKLATLPYEQSGEFGLEQIITEVESRAIEVRDLRPPKPSRSIKEQSRDALTSLEVLFQSDGGLVGLDSGFKLFNKMTKGLKNGEMVVIAGRPGSGKTGYSMNIAEHVAIEQGLPTYVFSLEMSADSLLQRMIMSRARVPLDMLAEKTASEREFARMGAATAKISNSKLSICDDADLTIGALRAKARKVHQELGIKLFVIDYLQLISGPPEQAKISKQAEVAEISKGLKNMAKELNVPVIVLAQLNRECEKDKGRKPRSSDLRESGQIEQDADFIGILYRAKSDQTDDEAEHGQAYQVNLAITKQRNGPRGDVPLWFQADITRFSNMDRVWNPNTKKWEDRSSEQICSNP